MRMMMAAAAAVLAAMSALAEDNPPPIRDFDQAKVEQLGQHLYRQDQFAWKATDALLAKVSGQALRDQGGRGWIVDEGTDRDVVRFVRENNGKLEVAYDITFVSGTGPVVSEPQDRVLTGEETAQYKARMLAAQNFDFRCTPTQPNAIAFRETPGGNWLVWVLTATTDPNLTVIGGHIRFTISPDASRIIAKDKLSKGCVIFDKPGPRTGQSLAAQMVTHVVSPRPVETHVFASLNYHLPLFVGTNDGKAWKVDDGHIRLTDEADDGIDGLSARQIAGMNEICSPIFAFTDPAEKGFTLGKTVQVISQLEKADRLVVDVPAGKRLSSVVCMRNSVIPSPNDYKLARAGILLLIMDHADHEIGLTVRGGKIEATLTKGPPLDDDANARLKKRLEQMQASFDGAAKK